MWGPATRDEIIVVVGVETSVLAKSPQSSGSQVSQSHILSVIILCLTSTHRPVRPWLSPTFWSSTSCKNYLPGRTWLTFNLSGLSSTSETTSLVVPSRPGCSLTSSVCPAATGEKLHRKVNSERLADMSGLILRTQFYSKWTHQCIFQTANHGSE